MNTEETKKVETFAKNRGFACNFFDNCVIFNNNSLKVRANCYNMHILMIDLEYFVKNFKDKKKVKEINDLRRDIYRLIYCK